MLELCYIDVIEINYANGNIQKTMRRKHISKNFSGYLNAPDYVYSYFQRIF